MPLKTFQWCHAIHPLGRAFVGELNSWWQDSGSIWDHFQQLARGLGLQN